MNNVMMCPFCKDKTIIIKILTVNYKKKYVKYTYSIYHKCVNDNSYYSVRKDLLFNSKKEAKMAAVEEWNQRNKIIMYM